MSSNVIISWAMNHSNSGLSSGVIIDKGSPIVVNDEILIESLCLVHFETMIGKHISDTTSIFHNENGTIDIYYYTGNDKVNIVYDITPL